MVTIPHSFLWLVAELKETKYLSFSKIFQLVHDNDNGNEVFIKD